MPQHLRDALEKWKSSDKSTNAAELTHCSSNAEASGPGLINSSFWLRRKKKKQVAARRLQKKEPHFLDIYRYIIYVHNRAVVISDFHHTL